MKHLTNTKLNVCCIAVFFSLVGCNFSPQIASDAVDYNLSLEKSGNELLLLNVARAYRRYPMYFSDLQKVNGSLSINSKLSAEFPVGGDAENKFPLKPEISYQSSPNFDVVPLNKAEFIRGILKPIDDTTFAYYWEYGWPKHVLNNLLIEKIDFYVDGNDSDCPARDNFQDLIEKYQDTCIQCAVQELLDKSFKPELENLDNACFVTLKNNPDDREEHVAFQTFLDNIDLDVKITDEPKEIVTGLTLKELSTIQTIVASSSQKLFVTSDSNRTFDIEKTDKKAIFRIKKEGAELSNMAVVAPVHDYNREIKGDRASTDVDDEMLVVFYLRSPQAALFYLGQILRAEHDQNREIIIDGEPLIKIGKTNNLKRRGRGDVSVIYRDEQFYIPTCNAMPDECKKIVGRTPTVLALINQLIGLQKEGKDLPLTQSVRLVGQ